MAVSDKIKQPVISSIVGAAVAIVAIASAGQLIFVTKSEMMDECKDMRQEFRTEIAKLRIELRSDMKEDHKETMAGLDRIISRIDHFHGGGD